MLFRRIVGAYSVEYVHALIEKLGTVAGSSHLEIRQEAIRYSLL
jgi:hypothetical protein